MTYIPKKRREKAATVHVDGKGKFPIDSAHTAKSALKLEGHAKPALTQSQRAAVERKAAKFGVHKNTSKPSPSTTSSSQPQKSDPPSRRGSKK